MTIIESLKVFFSACPELAGGKINVDFLSEHSDAAFSIDSVPCKAIVKRYSDGGTLRQYLFVVASREYYSQDVIQNIENNGLYERISAWVEVQNNLGNLPDLTNATAQSIEVSSTAYLLECDPISGNARYQIQCRITYYQD